MLTTRKLDGLCDMHLPLIASLESNATNTIASATVSRSLRANVTRIEVVEVSGKTGEDAEVLVVIWFLAGDSLTNIRE
jgi:hypothetical protein